LEKYYEVLNVKKAGAIAPAFKKLPTSSVSAAVVFVFEPRVIKMTAIEISSVIPLEIGAIVFVINPVAEVAVPTRVVIISIPGEIVLIDDCCRSLTIGILAIPILVISVLVHRSSRILFLINYRSGRGNIYPADRNPEPDVGIYIYLGVSRAGKQGAGDDRSKYK